ncbi:GGDEF domain-containing protein [Clostridium sp. B9]|uniref:GGDEF domain-containing protein n=1 Tax=Clostridium sp. B9 TaxID=3423224 RepID=UPI003D2ED88E
MEKLEIGLDYIKDKDFNRASEAYENLLDKIKKRGITSDIFYSVAYSLIKLSYENKEYENFTNQIVELYRLYENKEDTLATDSVLVKLNNEIFNKSKEHDRKKIYCLTFLLSISIGVITLIHIKNERIRRLNKELKKAIITDGLTKVYNKSYLYKTFEYIASKGSDVIFIMIDIDYFKKYNDNYGHLKGDEALIKVANIIKSTFKNDITFRYGGEEFSVISKRSRKEVLTDIKFLRERIYEENIEHKFSEVSDRITLSIGIDSLTINSMYDVELLITSSDKKLYESKVLGRNRYTI